MRGSSSATDYRLGTIYSLATAVLYAVQEPFSFPAAHRLSTVQFVCLTQIALLVSIPLILAKRTSRRDFAALLTTPSNYGPLAVILALGMTGLLLYNVGLAHAHPIIISAVLNLLPFWAALVALVIARVRIPATPLVFFGAFVAAFLGAMAVAWSQLSDDDSPEALLKSLFSGSWIYAVPVPIITALNGTLIAKWFGKYDEAAAIGANFLVANVILIPSTLAVLYLGSDLGFHDETLAIVLMIAGTIIASSVGRVAFQIALTVTGGDNGFVSMFLNLVPALTAVISFALSWQVADLHFFFDRRFFIGLGLIVASLVLFSWRSQRAPTAREGGGARP